MSVVHNCEFRRVQRRNDVGVKRYRSLLPSDPSHDEAQFRWFSFAGKLHFLGPRKSECAFRDHYLATWPDKVVRYE